MNNREADQLGFDTRVIHAGEGPDPVTGAHGVPLYQNATYAFRSYDQVRASERGEAPRFFYQRYGNPTVRCLELKMANLEGAESCAATSTGMAAISAALQATLGCGCHVVASSELYQVTHEVLDRDVPGWGGTVTKVDVTDQDAVESAMNPETKVVFVETLSNPNVHLADIAALSRICKAHDAILIVDNTFLSPALYRPIEDGADIVIHSATKYLSGTGQIMGGFISGSRESVANISGLLSRQGSTMPPFAAWQILSGIKTLPLRVERHSKSASQIAELLDRHAAVAEVNYPAISGRHESRSSEHVGANGFGGMLSVRLNGGEAAVRAFVDRLELFTIAVSLGEATSLVWPYADGTIRLSIGLENVEDLERDVLRALDNASG